VCGVSPRLMRIESTANHRVKGVKRLHRGRERRAAGRTILEGPKLLEAAVDAGVVPVEVYTSERTAAVERAAAAGAAVSDVSPAVLAALSTTVEPQDPVAVVAIPAFAPPNAERTIVLVDVGDPGNMGTLIRSAVALGWRTAVMGGTDPWGPKVLRAAAGAHFAAPLINVESLDAIRDAGLSTVATIVQGGVRPEEVGAGAAVALLIGSEAHGLPAEIVDGSDWKVTIPMPGPAESLNVSIAGAIAMYALGRRE